MTAQHAPAPCDHFFMLACIRQLVPPTDEGAGNTRQDCCRLQDAAWYVSPCCVVALLMPPLDAPFLTKAGGEVDAAHPMKIK